MLAIEYFIWHYYAAPGQIWGIMINYARSIWHRFLIVRHLKTLFAPWHRRQPSDVGGDRTFGSMAGNFFADIYIRILAAFVRVLIILSGIIAEVIVFVGFILLLMIWIVWPILLAYSVIQGLGLIF
ncbi:MAG: hypothetical protein Q8Q06_01750 [bacterium]|nr:hypothetical protein [bacterium]